MNLSALRGLVNADATEATGLTTTRREGVSVADGPTAVSGLPRRLVLGEDERLE